MSDLPGLLAAVLEVQQEAPTLGKDPLCQCGCGLPAPIASQTRSERGQRKGDVIPFRVGHAGRKPVRYIEEDRGYETACWVWQLVVDRDGYGRLRVGGRAWVAAHRHYYEEAHGVIPAGLHIDHLCRIRACVNPAHLEVVTPGENNRRGLGLAALNGAKTHCAYGHPFDEANTYITPDGQHRMCRACHARRVRAYRGRRQAT